MAIIKWIIGFIITVLVTVFAVINRNNVSVSWSPFPADDSISLPLYVVVLCAMALGFMIGAGAVWMNSGSLRREKRRQKREIKILEREVDTLKESGKVPAPPATDLFPALVAQSK